jgi:non-homologous end joining protein Ku
MREKQYVAAIRPYGKALALAAMLFADEVVDLMEALQASLDRGTKRTRRKERTQKRASRARPRTRRGPGGQPDARADPTDSP